jgi:hypothetical protein
LSKNHHALTAHVSLYRATFYDFFTVKIVFRESYLGKQELSKTEILPPTIRQMLYFPVQQARRFSRNAEIPSCASAASEFMLITSLA